MTGSQLLWYMTRGMGLVVLVLLTATVVLGIATSRRVQTASLPRFALAELHRRVSLLTLVFLGLHVVTAAADSFAPVGWTAIVVPFTGAYRRFWLGLGTIAFDLLLAVVVSSLLRGFVGHRRWRQLHWLAYVSWPVALVHAAGMGTDRVQVWVQGLLAVCVVTVGLAAAWRAATGLRDRAQETESRVRLAGSAAGGSRRVVRR